MRMGRVRTKMIRNIILASASPRRHELLSRFIKNITVVPADIDEATYENEQPKDYGLRLAREKCLKVAETFNAGNDLIIAADTIVVKNNSIFDKPFDKNEAYSTLKQLRNSSHSVITSVCMLDRHTNTLESFNKTTTVYFANFSDTLLDAYVNTDEPYDKAGAYGIQGMGCMLVDRIEGDYDNVVGLPVGDIIRRLSNLGIYFL